ncbi:cupin domain-containing protein [Komagataeibacter rhaeticus]|nr:cupin domain-containing protein [Komagataeibacter rhaeticus]
MTTSPAVFSGLLGGDLSGLVFTPFRPGVDICRLADNAAGETTLALLRYGAGASVPRHMHPDTETIIVLTGAQSDERGTYRAGDVVVNAPGPLTVCGRIMAAWCLFRGEARKDTG